MAIVPPTLPGVFSDYGYTQQCWLKVKIDRMCFGDQPWIWFSTVFGAWSNVNSSNPCSLYYDLSIAVYQQDVGSRLIKNLKSQMLLDIDRCLPPGNAMRAYVNSAPLTDFRPEVWRLDLNKIAASRGVSLATLKAGWRVNAHDQIMGSPGQILQPDEFLIKDLQQTGSTVEYEVIIER